MEGGKGLIKNKLLPNLSLQSQRYTQRTKQRGSMFYVTVSECCGISGSKDRVSWNSPGRLPGGGWLGNWALKNGFVFGEIETGGEGGLAGGAKVQQCIQQCPGGAGFGHKSCLFWGNDGGGVCPALGADPLGAWQSREGTGLRRTKDTYTPSQMKRGLEKSRRAI